MNSENVRDNLLRQSWREEPRSLRHMRLRQAINYLSDRIVRDCNHDHDKYGVCRYCGHENTYYDYDD